MEVIKFDKIVSVSSEAVGHEAKHLLNPEVDVQRSWLCCKGSQKSSVILKLEEATVINKVHLGNANSAFIEISVGRAASDEFQTLVPTSSFMTPNDSKASENGNKVRFFENNDFDPGTLGKRWDLIKIVCSQPFNKHTAFGICFVKIHGEVSSSTTPLFKKKVDEDIPVGAFFRKKKDPVVEGKSPSISERIREAEKPEVLAKHIPMTSTKVTCKVTEKPGTTSKESKRHGDEESDNRKNRFLGLEDEPSPKRQKDDAGTSGVRTPKEPKKLDDREDSRKNRLRELEEESSTKRQRVGDLDTSSYKTPKESKRCDKTDNEKKRLLGSGDTPSSKRQKDDSETSRVTEKEDKQREFKKRLKTPQRKEEHERSRVGLGREKPKKEKPSTSDVLEKSSKLSKKGKRGKPFNNLMDDVVFVISGYQNPERGTYRSHALEMGAKYRTDWKNGDCTHLIASYINTPKCNQVKGKGKIVSKDWIEKCYKDKKRYPWRRFALDKNDRRQAESDEEIDVEETSPPRVDPAPSTSFLFGTGKKTPKKVPNVPSSDDSEDIYDQPTDDEDNADEEPSSPKLPDFFHGMNFYIDENIADRALLERYVIAYDGTVSDKLDDGVQYFITSERGEILDVLKKSAKNFIAVSPTWIQAINCNQTFLPASNFVL